MQFSEPRDTGTVEAQIWDTEGLPFSQDFPQPVRVLESRERLTQFHYRKGERSAETTSHQWIWITTLDARTFPARQVWHCGHARWKNENNGWNDLTQNWALKHGFLHACRHRPQQPSAAGPPQPVRNRGLAAVTLILCLAFVLCSAFALLHSKIFRLYHPTLREIGRQLYRSLWQLQPPARAPTAAAEP
jgi:hypothetical protein